MKPDATNIIPAATLPDDSPRTLARAYLERHGMAGDWPATHHWRANFYGFDENRYQRLVDEEFRAKLYAFCEAQLIDGKRGPTPYKPSTRKINDVLDSMRALCQVVSDRMPCWLENEVLRPAPADVISFPNGILDVARYISTGDARLTPPTPLWFSENVVGFRFDRDAACPLWERLTLEWLEDPSAVLLLQEWFGLLLISDTRYQKMLLMIGPPRSGKGTTIRIMRRIIGESNCVTVYLSALGERFGLAPLLGKTAAFCPDAHLGRGSDSIAVLEKIKSIVGADAQQIELKHRDSLASVDMPIRFILACNEFPRLPDSSAAMRSRLLPLQFCKTFEGSEDRTLDDRLAAESPGILRWAIDGLRRLRQQGKFTVPESSAELLRQFTRLSSPVSAFVEDRCDVTDPNGWEGTDELWKAWGDWCKENAHQTGSKSTFAQHLRAAVPTISPHRPNEDGVRINAYMGVTLLGGTP